MADSMPNVIFYLGRSMHPFLQEGDEILYQPCDKHPIKRGDIIVFSPPGEDRIVIHRVITAALEGYRTQGDSNVRPDPWLLSRGEIIGRAVRYRRKGKDCAIRGGIGGIWRSASVRHVLTIRTLLVHVMDPVLRSAFYSGLLAGWIPQRYKPRVLSITRAEGTELILVMGERILGRRFAGSEIWNIRRRYWPLVDRQAIHRGRIAVGRRNHV
jgi:signal peptidase I